MSEPVTRDGLTESVEKLGIKQIERHLFLCCDQTKPKCCSQEEGLAVWEYLKKRLSELGLDRPTEERPVCIFRTKANCLRVCTQGPILLVYPDGVWYRKVDTTAIEQIIQEHLLQNKIVEEHAFVCRSLPAISVNSQGTAREEPAQTGENT
jgi:(2Fe-2S) ferredoxin